MVFFSVISFGPYCASRFFASSSLRPSGDEPSFFSTSGMGRVFRSSVASGLDAGFPLSFSAVGFMMPILVFCFLAIERYTFASGGSAIPPGGKNSGTSRRATPMRLSAIP